MTNKTLKKQRLSIRRRKREMRNRDRRKKHLKNKIMIALKRKMTIDKIRNYNKPDKVGLRVLIFRAKMHLIRLWRRILCFIGHHDWVQTSGIQGMPKFICRRCMKMSKEKFTGTTT